MEFVCGRHKQATEIVNPERAILVVEAVRTAPGLGSKGEIPPSTNTKLGRPYNLPIHCSLSVGIKHAS